MSSIRRRPNGKWRARYRDETNKEHAAHFATRAAGQQWLDEQTTSLVTGTYVNPQAGKVTFKDYAESWRGAQVHRSSTSTSVEQHLRLHVYPAIGARQLRSIRPSDIQALVRTLGESLSPSTVEVIYSRVAAVFNAAVRDRVLATTACVDVKRPQGPPSSTLDVLTTDQVFSLVDAITDRYKALILTGAGTGLRPGELFGLTADRIDHVGRELIVAQQLVRVRGQSVQLGPLKTNASYRTVPLPGAMQDALAVHLARWPADPLSNLVFTNERGAPIQQHPFSVVFARARKAAALPSCVTPHDLRHYYASLLIQSGASVTVVQARLGHGSAKTTLDTYIHLFPDEDGRTRDAVDHAFGNLADYPRTGEQRPA